MYFDENEGIGILIGTPESFQIGEVKKFDYEVICVSENIEFITSSLDQINVTDENGNDVTSYLWWYRPGTYSITVEAHYQCPAIRNDNKQPTNLVAVAQPASFAEAPSNLDAVDRDDLLASIQLDANPLGLDAHSTSSLPTPTNLEAKALLDSPSNLKATYLAVGPKNLSAVSDGTRTPIPPVENLDALMSPTGINNLDALESPSESVTGLDAEVQIAPVENLNALASPSTSVTNLDALASPVGINNLDALTLPAESMANLDALISPLENMTNLDALASPVGINNFDAQIEVPVVAHSVKVCLSGAPTNWRYQALMYNPNGTYEEAGEHEGKPVWRLPIYGLGGPTPTYKYYIYWSPCRYVDGIETCGGDMAAWYLGDRLHGTYANYDPLDACTSELPWSNDANWNTITVESGECADYEPRSLYLDGSFEVTTAGSPLFGGVWAPIVAANGQPTEVYANSTIPNRYIKQVMVRTNRDHDLWVVTSSQSYGYLDLSGAYTTAAKLYNINLSPIVEWSDTLTGLITSIPPGTYAPSGWDQSAQKAGETIGTNYGLDITMHEDDPNWTP